MYLQGEPKNPWMGDREVRGEGKAACTRYMSEQLPTVGSQARPTGASGRVEGTCVTHRRDWGSWRVHPPTLTIG